MKGRVERVEGAIWIDLREVIPWPRGGLTDSPARYQAGHLAGPAAPALTPGERILIDRQIAYLDELLASTGCQAAGAVEVTLAAAPPKHAEIGLRVPFRPGAGGLAAIERRVGGLCCAPVIAYRQADQFWYQCANCARVFCPGCLAADLAGEERDDGGWTLICAACGYQTEPGQRG